MPHECETCKCEPVCWLKMLREKVESTEVCKYRVPEEGGNGEMLGKENPEEGK